MKNLRTYLFLAIGFLALAGCQKDEIMTFDITQPGVVFPGAGLEQTYRGYNSGDKIYYVNESFLKAPIGEDTYTVDFPVKVSGTAVEKERIVGFRIVEENTTAKTSQYEITEAVIPAGQEYGYIRILLKRDEALDTTSVDLFLELTDSEDLKVGPKEYTKGKLNWSNMIPMFPVDANHTRTYNMIVHSPLAKTATGVAYYSPNAHRAVVESLGWEFSYWPRFNNSREDPNTGTTTIIGAYYSDLYARRLQQYLDAYELEHGEKLRHNAGTAKGVAIQGRINGVPYNPNL